MSTATRTLPEGPLTWQDVLDHPALQDLPFKIELNERGQIVMSPASNRHSHLQTQIAFRLHELMGEGEAMVECSVDTPKGTKVADVAWVSAGFVERHGYATPYPEAPDICVEVLSPSNAAAEMEEKIGLYLAKGAREVWICDLDGRLRFFDHTGERAQSAVAPDMATQV